MLLDLTFVTSDEKEFRIPKANLHSFRPCL